MTSVDFDDVKVKYEEHSSCDQDDAGVYGSLSSEKADSPMTPSILKSSNNASTAVHVDEKKMRRAIANSNERRRMQSINAGFQSLRALLPHHEGEKLSKATVLQQTAEYIYALQQDKTRLLSQNCKLKRMLGHQQEDDEMALTLADLASSRKRKATTALSSSENEDLRMQLNRERALRIHLEQKLNSLQGIYNDKIEETDLTSEHVTIQYHPGELEELTNKVSPVIVEPILIRRDSHCSTTNLNSPDSNSSSSTSILLQPSAHTDSFISISHHGNIATADHHMQQQSPSPPTPSCTILQQQQNIEIEKPDNVKLVESLPSPTSMSNSPSVPLTSTGSTTVMSANSPGANHIENDHILNSRLYISSASRPNLETIVEAIRHLEGDSMFFDKVAQDTPLALTTTKHTSPDFFHRSSHQQQRPGVIVVKPN